MKKITKEELKEVQEQQTELETIIKNLGLLETQKHALLHQVADLNKDIEGTKHNLEKKYGSININVENGEYTEIKKAELNKVD